MAKLWMWQGSHYASVTQCSEYSRICLDRVLNISWVLNMPEFWIWQGSEYARVTQGSKYATICLNMSEFTIRDRVLNIYHTIYSAEFFGKIIIVFNYFCKKNSILNLWEGSEYVPGFKYVRVLNIRTFS